MPLLPRIRRVLKYGSVTDLCRIAVDRVLRRLCSFRCLQVYLIEPGPRDGDFEFPDSRFRLEELSQDRILVLASDPEVGFYDYVVAQALLKNDRCFVVWDTEADRLAYFCWYSVKPSRLLHGYLVFDPRYFHSFHSFTMPPYRGLRLPSLVFRQVMADFGAAGYRGQITVVEWANFRSRRALTKRHATRIGRIIQYKLGKRKVTRVTQFDKDIRLGFSRTVPEEGVIPSETLLIDHVPH